MTNPLLVVGSVALDSIETRAGKREEILGGAATYIALSACHFTPVNIVAVVGRDDFADEHVGMLTSRGVDVTGLERVEGRTFRWSGVYADDFSSRTTLDTQLGVFESFDPRLPQNYLGARFLLLGNIDPTLQLKVLDSVGDECFTATDTMNLWIDIAKEKLEEVIARTDLLIINDEESLMLTGRSQVAVAARQILKMGPEALIIKRGEHGAYLFTEKTTFFAPAYPLPDVIDPTGAGDSFAGGLMGYLAGLGSTGTSDIKKGMIFGTAIASTTCEGFGVEATSGLDRPAIDRRYEALRRLTALD